MHKTQDDSDDLGGSGNHDDSSGGDQSDNSENDGNKTIAMLVTRCKSKVMMSHKPL